MSNNTNTSPYMLIPVPIPGTDPGPDYAQNLYNAIFQYIDQHDHSANKGAPLTNNSLSGITALTNASGVAIKGANTATGGASSGNVGELLISSSSSNNPVSASGVYFDMGSITLTTGDWNVSGWALLNRNGATFSSTDFGIGFGGLAGNNATSAEGITEIEQKDVIPTSFTTTTLNISTLPVQYDGVNLYIAGLSVASATGNVYFKGFVNTFTGANPWYRYVFFARRVR